MSQVKTYSESKREKAFRTFVVKQIPRFPNNRNTQEKLEEMSLANLLIHYCNWALRYVFPRPRKVYVEDEARNDPRWLEHQQQIEAFLKKVENGEELTPHLSLEPHTRGYTPAAAESGENRWTDKDFLLNAMGYHHFHLSQQLQGNGAVGRTRDLLFAKVDRENFYVIAIFDHSVFEQTDINQPMSKERERLWTIFQEHASRGIPAGQVYLLSPITTSGHPIHVVTMAAHYARLVRNLDSKLDEAEFVGELYASAGYSCPEKPKLQWRMLYLDIGLFDEEQDIFFALHKGPN